MRLATRPENPVEAIGMLAGMAPYPLFEGYFGLMAARTLMAGVQLGIFDALAEREDDAGGLARRLDLDPQGVDALCVALHSMRYLDRGDGGYRNAEQARKHLVSGCEQPLVDTLGSFSYDMWRVFDGLEDAVRSGQPVGGLHERPADDPWWESYMRGLFELSQIRAPQLVKLIPTREPRRLLDVAGGHGGFSLAMCRRHPGLEATVLELEGAARVGERIVAEQGMAERIRFQVGDMFTDELGSGYDVAMANSILHHLDAERAVELLRRARAALAPGGTMAVVEQERPAEGKRGEQIGALTGVLFYASSKVRTYSAAELEAFMGDAGLRSARARRHVMTPGVVVVSAQRPKEEA